MSESIRLGTPSLGTTYSTEHAGPARMGAGNVAQDALDSLQKTATKPMTVQASRLPAGVRGCINISKVIWATAWSITRLAAVAVALPLACLVHAITRNPSPKAAKTAENANNAVHAVLSKTVAKQAKTSTSKVKPELIGQAGKLEELKYAARKDPMKRAEYFEHYSKHVGDIFTVEGMNKSSSSQAGHNNKQDVNPELVKLSRESYINLNLVYRFDGPDMVGREITLIDDSSGSEKAVEYKVDRFFEESNGLVGYGLIPKDNESKAPPRLIFRGTSGASYVVKKNENTPIALNAKPEKNKLASGLASDSSGAIGKKTYENYEKNAGDNSISKWLGSVTSNGEKKAFVSGHSLGGAIAQRVAAANSGLVGEVFTLNSPRLEHNIKHTSVPTSMKITHVVMEGDSIVPRAGGGRLSAGEMLSTGSDSDTEVVSVRGGGHTSTILNDYCMRGKEPAYSKVDVKTQIAKDSFWCSVLNFIRPNIDYV